MGLEQCEARDVPAVYNWTGWVSTDPTDLSNWMVQLEVTPGEPPPPPPGLPDGDDELIFGSIASNDCVGLTSATDSFAAVHVQAGFTGIVSLGEGLEFGTFTLAGGTIDQPSSGTGITVTDSFSWTGGTLNSTTHLGTLLLDGADALFAPAGGGTVYLGSDITLANGAEGTMREGTIDLNKDGIEFMTSTGSSFFVAPLGLGEAVLGASRFLLGVIGEGTTWTVSAEAPFRMKGALGNAGTAILLPEARVLVTGIPLNDVAYSQAGASSATYLHGGSVLETAESKWVLIQGGILATVYSPSTGNATIITDTLQVTGGDIYVNYGQTTHVNFGELVVEGNVWWQGGTFHPYVYTGGTANDSWRTFLGTFTIDGGTVAPVYLDSDYGTSSSPHSGDSWEILKSGFGFAANSPAPSVDDTDLWMMQIDTGVPPIHWKLVAK